MFEFSVNERELERLKHALTLLSEAEKHLRVSTERSTWFTATLLQLGSLSSPDRTQSTSSRRQSSKTTDEDHISMLREATVPKQNSDAQFTPEKSMSNEKQVRLVAKPNQSQFVDGENLTNTNGGCATGKPTLTCMDSKMLINIWLQCIEKCHSKTLRQLLHTYGKLVCLSEMKGKISIRNNWDIFISFSPFSFIGRLFKGQCIEFVTVAWVCVCVSTYCASGTSFRCIKTLYLCGI